MTKEQERQEHQIRSRVTHGWAFRDHAPDEVAGIRQYLDTGDTTRLPERYARLVDLATGQARKGTDR